MNLSALHSTLTVKKETIGETVVNKTLNIWKTFIEDTKVSNTFTY